MKLFIDLAHHPVTYGFENVALFEFLLCLVAVDESSDKSQLLAGQLDLVAKPRRGRMPENFFNRIATQRLGAHFFNRHSTLDRNS